MITSITTTTTTSIIASVLTHNPTSTVIPIWIFT
jgi:hypothetical protein